MYPGTSTSVLTSSLLLSSVMIVCGTSFGTLGSGISNPFFLNKKEILLLSTIAIPPVYALLLFINSNSILATLVTSFVSSSLISAMRHLISFSGMFRIDVEKVVRGCQAV